MRLPGIVALEGIDGCAKSTQAALLANYLDAQAQIESMASGAASAVSKTCLRMKFPKYDTPAGKLIASKLKDAWVTMFHQIGEVPKETHDHANALVLQSLMLTNRFEVADEIEYACVTQGRSVVLDRYSPSAFAYGMADGLDYKWIESIHTRLPKAHYVLIDIPVEESFVRRPERTDAYESNKDRLSKARANYLHLFERNGVDTAYWQNGLGTGMSGDDQGYRTTGVYSIVNGLGTVDEVQERIRRALGI